MKTETVKFCLINRKQGKISIAHFLVAILLTIAATVRGQQLIPLPTGENDKLGVYIDSVRFVALTDTAAYGLQFSFVVMGDRLPRQERIAIRPLLTNGDSIAAFPPVEIDGQWVYYHHVRSDIAPHSQQYRSKDVITSQRYSQLMPSADWMQGALLHLEVERTNACGDTLCSRSFLLRAPTPVINTRQDEEIRHEEVHLLKGRAFVSFPINRSEVREDFRNNLVELERLRHTIDSVSATPGIDIVQIQLKGFASPEGSYANNDRLARERTSSLTRYIIEHTNISPMLFHTAYEPEDWQGLRVFVDTTTMITNRQALLDIIDSDREPDDKLAYLQKSFPDDYAKLKLKAFPLLRHTDLSDRLRTDKRHQHCWRRIYRHHLPSAGRHAVCRNDGSGDPRALQHLPSVAGREDQRALRCAAGA